MKKPAIAITAFTCLLHVLLSVVGAMATCDVDKAKNVSTTDRSVDVEYYNNTQIPISYKKNITIGYLTSLRGFSDKKGLAISGALTYALNQVSS